MESVSELSVVKNKNSLIVISYVVEFKDFKSPLFSGCNNYGELEKWSEWICGCALLFLAFMAYLFGEAGAAKINEKFFLNSDTKKFLRIGVSRLTSFVRLCEILKFVLTTTGWAYPYCFGHLLLVF